MSLPMCHALPAPTGAALPVAATIRELLHQARRALAGDPEAAERCIEGAVSLLPEMEVQPAEAPMEPRMAKGGLAPWQMLRASTLIEAQLSGRVPPAELAAAVRLGPSHFARAFKRSFGEPPHVYVNRRRIARAKTLMAETGKSLAEIALACGLSDQAHFCRLFRRFERCSPGEWRRLNVIHLEPPPP